MKTKYMILFTLFIFLGINVVAATYITEGVSNTQTTNYNTYITPGVNDTYSTDSVGSSEGSSSGGGSGNIISDESFANIESTCRAEKDLHYDTSTIYTFKCIVYEVVLSGTQNEADVTVRVDQLIGRSNKTPAQPDGDVYKFVNVYVGTKRFESGELRFKVPVSWTQNENIQMLRWKDNAWTPLETSKINEDSEFVYFSAKTDKFSNFAIVERQISSPTSQPQIVPATATTPISIETPATSEMTKESSGFGIFVMILALSGVVYIIRRKT